MLRSFNKLGALKSFFGKAARAVVGQMAPAFSGAAITNSEHTEVSLSDYKGKYVVLFFYPLDFTFVCPTEIVEFSNRHDEFEAIGAQVVGCSTGSQYSKEAWCNLSRSQGGIGNITYPLLADPTHNVSKDYGVYLPELGFPLRGTFIIDGNGTLRHLSHNDLPVGRSVDEVRVLSCSNDSFRRYCVLFKVSNTVTRPERSCHAHGNQETKLWTQIMPQRELRATGRMSWMQWTDLCYIMRYIFLKTQTTV